jgi:curved DNA-binding protein CbpA
MPKSKTNHYEVLGVKPDATPAELKRARRRKAEQSHPDKGGDPVEMAAINHAYDVLKDPARRLLYDATGEDNETPIEKRVQGMIMQGFQDALVKDAPNVLRHVREFAETTKATIKQQKAEGNRALKSLRERREKISTTAPVNAFHQIVDQSIGAIEQKLAALDGDLAMVELVMEELKSYTSTEKMVEAVTAAQLWAATGNSAPGSW